MTIWITTILSILLGYFLGRLYSDPTLIQKIAKKSQSLSQKTGLGRPQLGVVTPLTPEQLKLRKDPKAMEEEKAGEEIFDKILQ